MIDTREPVDSCFNPQHDTFDLRPSTFDLQPSTPNSYRRIGRAMAILCTGGCLLQLGGCAAGILPVLLSFVESAVISSITANLLAP